MPKTGAQEREDLLRFEEENVRRHEDEEPPDVEEERDRQLRLRCIEISFAELSGQTRQLMRSADLMYKYIKSGEVPED